MVKEIESVEDKLMRGRIHDKWYTAAIHERFLNEPDFDLPSNEQRVKMFVAHLLELKKLRDSGHDIGFNLEIFRSRFEEFGYNFVPGDYKSSLPEEPDTFSVS